MFPIPPQSSSDPSCEVYVSNEWDSLAEVVMPAYPGPSPWLDRIGFLLEAHGILVHRVRVPSPLRPLSVPHMLSLESRPNPTTDPFLSANPPLDLNAVVFSSKVIEAPPPNNQASLSRGLSSISNAKAVDRIFNHLQYVNAEVVRWPENETPPTPRNAEASLTPNKLNSGNSSEMEDSPKLCPSDVVILSANLFITRLSSKTNNKGLEYLWSVLAQSAETDYSDIETGSATSGQESRSSDRPIPLPLTTTLIVHVRESDRPLTPTPKTPEEKRHHRASSFSPRQILIQTTSASYIPLSRVLVPLNGRTMLYDPSCLATGEARRLKSVLDRLQDLCDDPAERPYERTPMMTPGLNRRDSSSSYGTFGSSGSGSLLSASTQSTIVNGRSEGWNFIPVTGLRATSILLISPTVALVSASQNPLNPPTNIPESESSDHSIPEPKILLRVSNLLASLGIQAISLTCPDGREQGIGVREAVTVLRRESDAPSKQEGGNSSTGGFSQDDDDDEPEGCLNVLREATTSLWHRITNYFKPVTTHGYERLSDSGRDMRENRNA